jgi:chromosome segregation ATPase
MVAAKQTNGGQQTPEELAVAHGIANYQRVVSERDELKRQMDKMEQLLTVHKIEIEGLRAEAAASVSRIESYQHERDDAVANLAVYQTLFTAILGTLRTFGIEHAPLMREVPKPNVAK